MLDAIRKANIGVLFRFLFRRWKNPGSAEACEPDDYFERFLDFLKLTQFSLGDYNGP